MTCSCLDCIIRMFCVQQKLKTGQYGSVGSFVDDIELMFNNARTFYEACWE